MTRNVTLRLTLSAIIGCFEDTDVRFVPKVGQFGPKWGKIRDFFQIRFSTFWLTEPKCNECDLEKNPGFIAFGVNLTYFGPKSDHPVLRTTIPGYSADVQLVSSF